MYIYACLKLAVRMQGRDLISYSNTIHTVQWSNFLLWLLLEIPSHFSPSPFCLAEDFAINPFDFWQSERRI